MKKLVVSMVLVLTASILMSSTAFAAMLKPKSDQNTAPKSSSSEKDAAKSTAKKNVTIMQSKDKVLSITIPKVAAVKKEKIIQSDFTGNISEIDATIYEVVSGDSIITASKKKGAFVHGFSYTYDAKIKGYTTDDHISPHSVGEIISPEANSDKLYSFNLLIELGEDPRCLMGTSGIFIRVVPAK